LLAKFSIFYAGEQFVPSDSLNIGNASIPEPGEGCVVSAAIYARQSRVRDVAYSSCQSQIDMCREFAASKDWSITQVYSDEGYSSETLDRPQMSQLISSPARDLDGDLLA
jgi:hypothetical protein